MNNEAKIIDIAAGVRLHIIKTDNFKSVINGIYIKRPLVPIEASYNAFLAKIMEHGTNDYPTTSDFNDRMEYLYGALTVADVHKYGEKQTIQIKSSFPNEDFLEEDEFYEVVTELVMNLFLKPKLIDGGYDWEQFEQTKERILTDIEMRRDDKSDWAVAMCVETMASEENYRIHELGTKEWIEEITPCSLNQHREKLIREAEIDIIVMGDIKEDRFEKIYKDIFRNIERGNVCYAERENIYYDINEVKYHEEKHRVKQSRLVMGYRINVGYESLEYTHALLSCMILGGSGGSKLFTRLREELSLCYTVYSRLDKFKSIMLVYSGIDKKNYEQSVEVINEELEKIKNGDFTDAEIDSAKQLLVANLVSIPDFQNSCINFYYGNYMIGGDTDIDVHIERVMSTTKENIQEVTKKFVLDTIAFLTEEEANGDN